MARIRVGRRDVGVALAVRSNASYLVVSVLIFSAEVTHLEFKCSKMRLGVSMSPSEIGFAARVGQGDKAQLSLFISRPSLIGARKTTTTHEGRPLQPHADQDPVDNIKLKPSHLFVHQKDTLQASFQRNNILLHNSQNRYKYKAYSLLTRARTDIEVPNGKTPGWTNGTGRIASEMSAREFLGTTSTTDQERGRYRQCYTV